MEPVDNRVLQTQLSQNFASLPSMRFLRIDAPLTLSLGGTSVPWPQRSKVKELKVNDGVTLLKDLAAFLEGFEGLEKFDHCCNFSADPFFNDLAATFVKALRDQTMYRDVRHRGGYLEYLEGSASWYARAEGHTSSSA